MRWPRSLAWKKSGFQLLAEILRLVEPSDGWFIECLANFLVPYVHEDVAIIGAALLIVEHGLPSHFAMLGLYAGMVSSDLAL